MLTKQLRIFMQEEVDRYIASCLLSDFAKTNNLNVVTKGTDIKCPVDLECVLPEIQGKFYVEIKERNKGQANLEKYGYQIELRESKLKRILDYTKGTPTYYISLFTNKDTGEKTGYCFYLGGIDFTKLNRVSWNIKKTEMDPGSEYVDEFIYQIPMKLAFYTRRLEDYYVSMPEKLMNYKRRLDGNY